VIELTDVLTHIARGLNIASDEATRYAGFTLKRRPESATTHVHAGAGGH
jgi:hypothetical protein